jgi:DNA polymerase V
VAGPVALVDCNNFYASCERVFQPALRGRPVVVLSNNDGCVIARSNEAKVLGVGMGEPPAAPSPHHHWLRSDR